MQIIILAGANGAGKSTLAPFLLRDTLWLLEYVNADTIARGLSAFQPEEAAFAAGRVMLRRLHELAKARKDFAFETTLATRSYAPWLRGVRREGYSVHLVFLWLRRVELAIDRVKERVRAGGHDVPEAVIRRRYQRGLENFFRIYQGLANTWAVYDNSASAEPVLVASGGAGTKPIVRSPELWYNVVKAAK